MRNPTSRALDCGRDIPKRVHDPYQGWEGYLGTIAVCLPQPSLLVEPVALLRGFRKLEGKRRIFAGLVH